MDVDACMESSRPDLEANRRTANTIFHALLNPSPKEGLTDEQLRDTAREYVERMGYGDQPFIVFKHRDISREHLHLVFATDGPNAVAPVIHGRSSNVYSKRIISTLFSGSIPQGESTA